MDDVSLVLLLDHDMAQHGCLQRQPMTHLRCAVLLEPRRPYLPATWHIFFTGIFRDRLFCYGP